MKRLLSVLLVIATLVSIISASAVSASAAGISAYDVISSSNYAKTYALSNKGITIPYTNKNLSTRGTVTYGKSTKAYIDNKKDEIYVHDVGVNKNKYWAYVSYPVGSKRAYAYINLSDITGNNGTHAKSTATGKFYCSYRKGVAASSKYYVAKGDEVYLIGKYGNQYQILYPISGNKWRIGFCSKNDYNRYCTLPQKTNKESSTYSVTNKILTVNGVKMKEFPIGSRYTSSSYVSIGGKRVNMRATQCCGYARYIQYKLFGSHYYLNNSKFPNLAGSENVYPNANGYKKLITAAGVGAHIRTLPNSKGTAHSMVVIGITANGFTVTDANADNRNTVAVRTYTWSEYAKSSYGTRGLDYIEVYRP